MTEITNAKPVWAIWILKFEIYLEFGIFKSLNSQAVHRKMTFLRMS